MHVAQQKRGQLVTLEPKCTFECDQFTTCESDQHEISFGPSNLKVRTRVPPVMPDSLIPDLIA